MRGRAPLWVISPYAKRGAVTSTYCTQINVVKTIEQILGAQPMNQVYRAAEPMTDLFTEKPDLSPYTTLPNRIPLDYGLKKPVSAAAAKTADSGAQQPQVPAHLREIAAQWEAWSAIRAETTGGSHPREDQVNPAQLNRITWYASTGWTKPYPGGDRILAPKTGSSRPRRCRAGTPCRRRSATDRTRGSKGPVARTEGRPAPFAGAGMKRSCGCA
ncbi:hypothetical protein [Streptomyces sp. NPDC048411]|uniref:hypothetical protein n=1 Tax=Streptomyces sp. NPDC048411 TaxID=3157206 RepID=UPI003456F187